MKLKKLPKLTDPTPKPNPTISYDYLSYIGDCRHHTKRLPPFKLTSNKPTLVYQSLYSAKGPMEPIGSLIYFNDFIPGYIS